MKPALVLFSGLLTFATPGCKKKPVAAGPTMGQCAPTQFVDGSAVQQICNWNGYEWTCDGDVCTRGVELSPERR